MSALPGDIAPRGLTGAEAARLLAANGPNETLELGRASPLRELLRNVTSPLILILLFASVVSALVGEVVNAVVIAAMVVMGAGLGWWQSVRAHRATERLRLLVAPTATALRDGEWRAVPRRGIVIGDVVRLNAGDVVPADARLVASRDLHVQEAILTGESVPAEKGVAAVALASPRTERSDVVYLGTSVTSGTATAIVFATGPATEVGKIAASLARPAPETAFDRGTRQFGFFIMRMVLFLVAFVSVVNIALHRDPLDSILFAIALAVGLTPEYMPMIMTVTLAQGASRMAKAGVIVKSLGAIQNLGSMDILCSDKTNTLTTGELVLERCVPVAATEETLLRLGAINAAFQSGIDSTLDRAILDRAHFDAGGVRKIDEIPFDFERRRVSVVVECDGRRQIVTKGAPEDVVALCAADDAARKRASDTIEALSSDGLRVLAVAARPVDERAAYGATEERDLVLAGFLAFADPPIEGVAATLAALREDGVELKVLSGDHVLVARHVCGQLGLPVGTILDGDAIDGMDDRALAAAVASTNVYARVRP